MRSVRGVRKGMYDGCVSLCLCVSVCVCVVLLSSSVGNLGAPQLIIWNMEAGESDMAVKKRRQDKTGGHAGTQTVRQTGTQVDHAIDLFS